MANPPQKTTLTLSGASGPWNNLANLFTTATSYANYYETASGGNRYARFNTNASTVIPANAQLLGVEVKVKSYVSSTAKQLSLAAGPGDFGGGYAAIYPTTSATVYTFGGPTDLNGAVTIADLATGSLRVTAAASGNAYIYANSVSMDVHWQLPDPGNPLFFGELF